MVTYPPTYLPTASFHGDTNGLASIAVVGAVHKVLMVVSSVRVTIVAMFTRMV